MIGRTKHHIRRVKHYIKARRPLWRRRQADALDRWHRDQGERIRHQFDLLKPEAKVLDFGGFRGDWTFAINDRYGCEVDIFEPHPVFAADIAKRFAGNDAIRVHAFALGASRRKMTIIDDGDASREVSDGHGSLVVGEVVPVQYFFDRRPVESYEIAKINIEGGEYELMPELVSSGVLRRIKTLQIQFHLSDRSDIALRRSVIASLKNTHKPDWVYPFVWEQWSRKNN